MRTNIQTSKQTHKSVKCFLYFLTHTHTTQGYISIASYTLFFGIFTYLVIWQLAVSLCTITKGILYSMKRCLWNSMKKIQCCVQILPPQHVENLGRIVFFVTILCAVSSLRFTLVRVSTLGCTQVHANMRARSKCLPELAIC